MDHFDVFFSFEWIGGMPIAQVLYAALCTSAPALRIWLAQDPQSVAASGVAASRAFVFLATNGALRRPNVRHEVACAAAGGKRVIVLLEAGGPSLDELLAQAEGYVQADPAGDASAGRMHLDAAGMAAFAAAARAACIPFHRDARLVSECVPALVAALEGGAGGAPPPPPPPRSPFCACPPCALRQGTATRCL